MRPRFRPTSSLPQEMVVEFMLLQITVCVFPADLTVVVHVNSLSSGHRQTTFVEEPRTGGTGAISVEISDAGQDTLSFKVISPSPSTGWKVADEMVWEVLTLHFTLSVTSFKMLLQLVTFFPLSSRTIMFVSFIIRNWRRSPRGTCDTIRWKRNVVLNTEKLSENLDLKFSAWLAVKVWALPASHLTKVYVVAGFKIQLFSAFHGWLLVFLCFACYKESWFSKLARVWESSRVCWMVDHKHYQDGKDSDERCHDNLVFWLTSQKWLVEIHVVRLHLCLEVYSSQMHIVNDESGSYLVLNFDRNCVYNLQHC